MQRNPLFILLGVSVMLWLGAQSWRRKRLKSAARDLPTRLQRLLGPEPSYDPPEGLGAFVSLHKRTRKIEWAARGLAALWLVYVLFLMSATAASAQGTTTWRGRTSLANPLAMIHDASFAQTDGAGHDVETCRLAAELVENQYGVSTQFRCDPGRARKARQ